MTQCNPQDNVRLRCSPYTRHNINMYAALKEISKTQALNDLIEIAIVKQVTDQRAAS